jgi:hypothetical protein
MARRMPAFLPGQGRRGSAVQCSAVYLYSTDMHSIPGWYYGPMEIKHTSGHWCHELVEIKRADFKKPNYFPTWVTFHEVGKSKVRPD